jgi:hypothetical protein
LSELSDDQIKEENKFLQGLPRVNIAAFLMPPIWGPAHGIWATILFYPVWLFADNMFYTAFTARTTVSIIFAILTFIVLFGLTLAFSIVSQPFAAHRAEDKGISRQDYLKRQRFWAVGCGVLALVMIAFATYYNLVIRSTVG